MGNCKDAVDPQVSVAAGTQRDVKRFNYIATREGETVDSPGVLRKNLRKLKTKSRRFF